MMPGFGHCARLGSSAPCGVCMFLHVLSGTPVSSHGPETYRLLSVYSNLAIDVNSSVMDGSEETIIDVCHPSRSFGAA